MVMPIFSAFRVLRLREPYLVDPGTFCYAPDPVWARFFRSSTATAR